MPRRPDRRFKDCLLTGQSQSQSDEHTITWDDNPGLRNTVCKGDAFSVQLGADVQQPLSLGSSSLEPKLTDPVDDDVDFQLALYESMLQQKNDVVSREDENRRVESAKIKYGFVNSRLRLFKSEPLVETLLQCIEWECTSCFEQNGPQPVVSDKNQIISWIKNQSSTLHVLLELDLLHS
jgi:hypothetical protein